jgi:phosphoketolase
VSSITALIDRLDRDTVVIGGEDALAAAFGAALDNPGVVAVCVIQESRAWHVAPEGGAVLPVLALDGNPVYGGLSDEALTQHFAVFGWQPVFGLDAAIDLDARPLVIAREPVELEPSTFVPGGSLTLPEPDGVRVDAPGAETAVNSAEAYLAAVAAANPGRFRVEDDDRGRLAGYIATGRHGVARTTSVGPVHQPVLLQADRLPPLAGDVNVLLPADANTLVATLERNLDRASLIVTSGRELPQYLTLAQARAHVAHGASTWEWASSDGEPDLVIAACGDIPTVEALAATALLREHVPELRVRFVNVNDLSALAAGPGLSQGQFSALFTKERPVVFAWHGHASAIHGLTHRRPQQTRFHVCASVDRYSLAIEALTRADLLAAEMLPSMSGEFAIRAVPEAEKAINAFQALRDSGETPPPFRWRPPAAPSEPPIVM